jgi:sRNA-binding regulator protein Hfq
MLAAGAHAESVYLKDGKVLRGTITEEDDKMILLETNDIWQKIDKSAIDFVMKDERPPVTLSGLKVVYAGGWQTVLKLAVDAAGRHSFSNVSVKGTNSVQRGSSTIGTGISLSAEEIHYASPWIGLGVGISYQSPRKEPVSGGEFSFVPIYGLLQVRSTPTEDNGYFYGIGQFGYNYFIADAKYAGAGTYTMTNGAYAGLGAGYVFGRLQVEALYTVDQGKMSGNDVDSTNTPYTISADASYRKLSLSVGMLF